MKSIHKFLSVAAAIATLVPTAVFAQITYQGNGSTGFGGPLGQSTLTVSDSAPGVISFSLALGGNNTSFNDIAFYFSTGASGGESSTTDVTDTGDEGRQAISGQGTSDGHTIVTFANGFSAKYAVALDANGNANLFQLVPGQGYLTYVSGANDTHVSGSNVYGFSINETALGLTPQTGASFSFVATLSNAASDGSNVYRSNETIGASNVDNNSQGNLAFTGNLIYSGFDTYVTAVPEPATWLAGGLLVVVGGLTVARSRRLAA